MIELTKHFDAVSSLYEVIDDIKQLCETLPESSEKYELKVRAEMLERTTDEYSEGLVFLLQTMLNFSMRVAL